MRISKPEKLAGYILLIIGFILIFIPILISIQIVLGNMQIPQYVQKPSVSGTDSNAELATVMADAFPLLNVIPTFLLFVVIVYAGSVFMGKGVGLIKEIDWKVVKATKEETEETAETADITKKRMKRAQAERQEEE